MGLSTKVVERTGGALLVLAMVVGGCGTDDADAADPGVTLPERDASGAGGCGCTLGGECRPGNEAVACGRGGAECTACTGDQRCIDGVCRGAASCGPSNCAGCCRPDDTCAEGTASDACGAGGTLCETCSNGAACKAGKCEAPCSVENCLGCCRADGSCSTGKQPDSECGAAGAACAPCDATEVCSTVDVYVDGSTTPSAQAGRCVPQDCGSCAPGCCAIALGGGVKCEAGTTGTACGGNGKVCSVCAADESCTNNTCVPNADVVFKLVLLGATLPAEDAGGSSWDYLSKPDVGIIVRIKTSPETVSVRVDGPDDTTTPSFASVSAISAKLSDFKDGIFFDVVDRDSPDPDDAIGTVPAVAYVPSDAAFLAGAAPIEVGAGDLKVRFRFVRQ